MAFNGVTNSMQASSLGVRPAVRNALHHAGFHFHSQSALFVGVITGSFFFKKKV